MLFLDVVATSGVDNVTLEQAIALLQTLDSETVMAFIDKLINSIVVIVASFGGIFAFIQTRFNKSKLKLEGSNFAEKSKNEQAIVLMGELKSEIKVLNEAYKETVTLHKEEVEELKQTVGVGNELLQVALKTGTFSADGMMELGAIIERAGSLGGKVVEGLTKSYEENVERVADTTSILDKDEV